MILPEKKKKGGVAFGSGASTAHNLGGKRDTQGRETDQMPGFKFTVFTASPEQRSAPH